MKIIAGVDEMRAESALLRRQSVSLALVPTMGALHAGHLALVQEAKRRADAVVVSIFVNPSQFGAGEDYDAYPRMLDADLEQLADLGGVDVVFAPSAAGMYPDGPAAQRSVVSVGRLTEHLCGAYRPGHFDGVSTVVLKLFNICAPTIAVFGRKDAQQFLVLRRMARDLNLGIEVVGIPTVRENDGLALSSRNTYLTAEERKQAPVLFRAVTAAENSIQAGERDGAAVRRVMEACLGESSLAKVQYAEVVDADELQPVSELVPSSEVLAAVAVFFGSTRLIDNVFVTVPARTSDNPG